MSFYASCFAKVSLFRDLISLHKSNVNIISEAKQKEKRKRNCNAKSFSFSRGGIAAKAGMSRPGKTLDSPRFSLDNAKGTFEPGNDE